MEIVEAVSTGMQEVFSVWGERLKVDLEPNLSLQDHCGKHLDLLTPSGKVSTSCKGQTNDHDTLDYAQSATMTGEHKKCYFARYTLRFLSVFFTELVSRTSREEKFPRR